MKVERWDADRHGPPSERALRQRLEERGYDVAVCHYPPGTRFPPHQHDVDKIDAVRRRR